VRRDRRWTALKLCLQTERASSIHRTSGHPRQGLSQEPGERGRAADTRRDVVTTHKTQCIACKQDIPTGALVCSQCKHFQQRWKNSLQYFAGVATVLVIMVSAITWLWGNARSAFWPRDDVRVISANTLGSAVVVNRGDGEAFVSHLIFTMPGRSADWIAPRLVFEERISPGQFVRREFPKSKFPDKVEFVRGLTADEFEKLIARATNGDSCLELAFFEGSDSLFRELQQMAGATLNTFEVAGYLQYWGINKATPIAVPLKGTGVLRRCL
jgi:predicted nucleic acid-binding Zn ribbon protein